jgi:hypothetical protein
VAVNADPSEGLTARLFRSNGARRLLAFVALVAAGILDFASGANHTVYLVYLPVLLALTFTEPWRICLLCALAAVVVAFGADLVRDPLPAQCSRTPTRRHGPAGRSSRWSRAGYRG